MIAAPGEAREEGAGGARRSAATTLGVELGAAAQPRAHRDPAAAPAEGDAAVRGGAEVVDQGAAVGDALAAGPADLLEQLGHRLGEDDVGGGDREPAAQRPAPAPWRRRRSPAPRAPARTVPRRRCAPRPRPAPSRSAAHRRGLVAARRRAPRSRSRRPSARRAGCTVAALGETAPPRKSRRGAAGRDLRRARAAAAASATPSSRQAASAPRPGRRRGPPRSRPGGSRPGRNQASTPSCSQKSPIPSTACVARRGRRRAPASSPQRSRMLGQREPHHVAEAAVAAARPAGRSARASSRTTRASGSSCFRCQAAQRPVKPPPTTTTSASRSPASGGAGVDRSRLLQPVAVWRCAPSPPASVADRPGGRA